MKKYLFLSLLIAISQLSLADYFEHTDVSRQSQINDLSTNTSNQAQANDLSTDLSTNTTHYGDNIFLHISDFLNSTYLNILNNFF